MRGSNIEEMYNFEKMYNFEEMYNFEYLNIEEMSIRYFEANKPLFL